MAAPKKSDVDLDLPISIAYLHCNLLHLDALGFTISTLRSLPHILLRALRLDELFVHASVIDTSSESTFDILSRSDFDIAFCVESIVKELAAHSEALHLLSRFAIVLLSAMSARAVSEQDGGQQQQGLAAMDIGLFNEDEALYRSLCVWLLVFEASADRAHLRLIAHTVLAKLEHDNKRPLLTYLAALQKTFVFE